MTQYWWGIAVVAAGLGAVSACTADGAGDDTQSGSITGPCVANQAIACSCPDGRAASRVCSADGVAFGPCMCGGGFAGGGAGTGSGGMGSAAPGGDAGTGPRAGSGAGTSGSAGSAGMASGTGGMAGVMPPTAGAAGMMTSTGGMSGGGGVTGGGGSAATGDDVPATEHCQPVADWDPAWVAFEEEVLRLVNQNRAMGWNCDAEGQFGAAGPLTMQPNLRCAARLHSQDMSVRGYFDHENPDGDGPPQRMDAAGYSGGTYGENIAMGQRTPEQVVAGWMDSDGHCANIMHEDFTEIGVGFFQGDGRSGYYWTQNFGAPCNGRWCQ